MKMADKAILPFLIVIVTLKGVLFREEAKLYLDYNAFFILGR